LIEREDVRPSPYLGRYNWVMLERLDALGNDELRDLIRQSYEIVVAKSPKLRASSARKGSGKKKVARRSARKTP
jgi:predicted DNA-binding protein (MmcQ/YjbR family)